MTAPVDNRVARRRRETRARLLDAARTLYAAQGLETSIAAIAERADVGLGTFYLHFADKNDLLAAVIDDDERQIAERIAAASAAVASPLARHRLGTRIYLEHAYQRRYLFPILFDTVPAAHPSLRAMRRRWIEATAALLRAGVEAGEVVGEPELLAGALVAIVGQAALWWRDHEQPEPAVLADQLSRFIEHGLSGAGVAATNRADEA